MGATEFLLSACTDLAFMPALYQVARHRRHFELFVGVFQLVAAFMFNLSHALASGGVFLATDDWHFMSDVLTETYACCLLVHCAGFADENVNIVLRYTAFALAWIFKSRDMWDSAAWEAVLIAAFVCMAAYGFVTQNERRRANYDVGAARLGAASLAGALIVLGLEVSTGGDSLGLLYGVMHLFGGSTAYFLWKAVPAFDNKKHDDALTKNATFV